MFVCMTLYELVCFLYGVEYIDLVSLDAIARPHRQEQAQLPGGPPFSHYVTGVVRPMVFTGLNI